MEWFHGVEKGGKLLTSRLSSDFLVIILGSDITLCLGGIIPIMPISFDFLPQNSSSWFINASSRQHGMRS